MHEGDNEIILQQGDGLISMITGYTNTGTNHFNEHSNRESAINIP
jgi:hypothetical protein